MCVVCVCACCVVLFPILYFNKLNKLCSCILYTQKGQTHTGTHTHRDRHTDTAWLNSDEEVLVEREKEIVAKQI